MTKPQWDPMQGMVSVTVDNAGEGHVIVEYSGSIVLAKIDKEVGLLACPICEKSYFASHKDLISHIVSHARNRVVRRGA